ncbi:MAG: hypothetical protein F6K24_03125 [Okeania sp. SIO2D1]|nr:hypothetical protein [Okeania sp. SIO2D1]
MTFYSTKNTVLSTANYIQKYQRSLHSIEKIEEIFVSVESNKAFCEAPKKSVRFFALHSPKSCETIYVVGVVRPYA